MRAAGATRRQHHSAQVRSSIYASARWASPDSIDSRTSARCLVSIPTLYFATTHKLFANESSGHWCHRLCHRSGGFHAALSRSNPAIIAPAQTSAASGGSSGTRSSHESSVQPHDATSELGFRPLESLTDFDAGLLSSGLLFEANRVYTCADRDRSGTLSFKELEMMRKLITRMDPKLIPAPLTPRIADDFMASRIDTDGSNDIDRREWVVFVAEQAKRHGERPMLKLMQTLGLELDKLWTP